MRSTQASSSGNLWRMVGLAALGALGAVGCGEDGVATGNTCPTTQTLTYENFGQEFMSKHCLACHSATGPESPKFDTLEQIKANIDAIDKAAAAGPDAVNTSMPEGGSVDEAERRKLGEWLACKAP
jgi:uncharacterized membrane protein